MASGKSKADFALTWGSSSACSSGMRLARREPSTHTMLATPISTNSEHVNPIILGTRAPWKAWSSLGAEAATVLDVVGRGYKNSARARRHAR